jgi:type IV secretory pathway VirJ component
MRAGVAVPEVSSGFCAVKGAGFCSAEVCAGVCQAAVRAGEAGRGSRWAGGEGPGRTRARSRRRFRIGTALVLGLSWLGLGACSREPRREIVEHGRFPKLELVIPDSPRAVALLLAGPAELERAEALVKQLSKEATIVTRVDAEAFKRVLNGTPSGCVFPSGDLDNLAHFVQAYLRLPSYQPAILVGLGAGAGLAAGALTQAPAGTFAGAVVFDFCGDKALDVPLCPAEGRPHPEQQPTPREHSQALPAPAAALADPLLRLRSDDHTCPAGVPASDAAPAQDASAFPQVFTSLAAAANARATSSPSDLGGLPINEVEAEGTEHSDIFAVLLSGDGGWAGIDKEVSERLAERGVPVVGVDSLRYFWVERTPESAAADLDRVIERYQNVWNRSRVVLIGYSQGADVLPFLLNRVSPKTRKAIVSTVALSLSTTATFEFHVRDWVGAPGDRATLPEVQRLAPGSLVCVYGDDDPDALCPQLEPSAFRVFALPGDHHFNGDYDRVADIIFDSLPKDSPPK